MNLGWSVRSDIANQFPKAADVALFFGGEGTLIQKALLGSCKNRRRWPLVFNIFAAEPCFLHLSVPMKSLSLTGPINGMELKPILLIEKG